MPLIDSFVALHRQPTATGYYALRAQRTAIADRYRLLSKPDAAELAQDALKLYTGNAADIGECILGHLAAFAPASLRSIQPILAEQTALAQPQLYYRAGEEARDTLLRKLHRIEADMGNLKPDILAALLKALAWVGDKVVQGQFYEWWLMPPRWRSLLALPPHEYARAAGWHLTKDGRRRDLTYPEGYELLRLPDEATPPASNVVTVGVPAAEGCPSGQGSALTLMEFDLASQHPVFLGLRGERLRILTCLSAIQDGPLHTEIDLKGRARWLQTPPTTGGEHPVPELPVDRMVLGNPRHTILEALADSSSLVGLSGLGGHPTWLNGAVYPEEPFSGRPMVFVGQVAAADLLADVDAPGMFYAFLNEDATIAATFYQEL